MRSWFAVVSKKALPSDLVSKAQPLAQLDDLAERSPAKAREGLAMAITDLIEMTAAWSDDYVEAVDAELQGQGLQTLRQMRARFSKSVSRAVRRGRITDEAEFHAVRNAAELAGPGGPLWSLLAAYEESLTR